MISTSEKKVLNDRISELESELRKAKYRIKQLEQWKQETLNSVRELVYSFSLIPGLFDSLEDGPVLVEEEIEKRPKALVGKNASHDRTGRRDNTFGEKNLR